MYNENLKLLARKIDLVHLPNEFKFGEFSDELDLMELYEELFDYSYEIMRDLPLFSNFNLFAKNKEKVKSFLLENLKDNNLGEILKLCYEFCDGISELL